MRAWIRGMGVVFPGGSGLEAFAGAMARGESLATPSRLRPGMLVAQMGESLKPLVERKGLTALSRGALLAAAALEDLGRAEPWIFEDATRSDCALIVGTAFGHIDSRAEFHREARRDGVRFVSPILFPNTIINSLAGHAAILFGVSGPNSTVTSGRRSGLEALLRGATLLAAGRAPRAIVVGCDEVSATLLRGLDALGDDTGQVAVPPGEAAAALLLEPDAGSPPEGSLGRLLGAAERSGVRRTLRQAAEEAMRAALAAAGLEPGAVSGVHLSGECGGEVGKAEREAARNVFGSSRSFETVQTVLGETAGAQGVLAAAAGLVRGRVRSAGSSHPGRGSARGPFLVSSVDSVGATCAVFWADEVHGGSPGPA